MTSKTIHIHLGPNEYVKDGDIHLLCTYKEYKELQAFFSKHFDTVDCTKDEIGFPVAHFRCKAGQMFVRNEDGSLKENE